LKESVEIPRAGTHPARRGGDGDVEKKHVVTHALLPDAVCRLVVEATIQDVLSGARK
jgi:hypothetical protein